MAGSKRLETQDLDAGRDVLARMRDLDTRKAAAAKQAGDAKLARQRERTRQRVRTMRERMKAKQAVTKTTNECESEQTLSIAEKDKLFNTLFGAPPAEPPKENKVRQDLLRLSRDRKAPASARVTALRTVAEMDGHIGRLQSSSADTTDLPLASMTRAQLEDELRRLRVKIAPSD